MSGDEGLNMEKIERKKMEEFDRKLFKALKFFMRNGRGKIAHIRELDNKLPMGVNMEGRLAFEGYIDKRDYDIEIHISPERLITRKGYKKFHELDKIRLRYITIWWIIIPTILAAISLYFTGISQGWWTDFLGIAKVP